MTRDEVLEEAWQVANREVLAATGLAWDANARGRASAAAYIRQGITNLKSKPPEKSPEVDDSVAAGQPDWTFGQWLAQESELRFRWSCASALNVRLRAEMESLRADYDCLLAQRDREYVEAQALRTERDALRAELARLKWEAAGAPQKGE